MEQFSGLPFVLLVVIVAVLASLPAADAGELISTVTALLNGVLGRDNQHQPQPQPRT